MVVLLPQGLAPKLLPLNPAAPLGAPEVSSGKGNFSLFPPEESSMPHNEVSKACNNDYANADFSVSVSCSA